MKIKTIQWNIGGGKIRDKYSDSTKTKNYSLDGIEYILKILARFNPDIITLQETHALNGNIQAEYISKKLGFAYFYNDEYDHSHLEKGQRLGQAVISRFPLTNHKLDFFYNPKYRITRPDGEIWISHNKGITSCIVDIENKKLLLQTLHLIPFRKFNVDALGKDAKQTRNSISQNIMNDTPLYLLQGDFNYDDISLKTFLPEIFKNNLQEVLQDKATTPKGRKYDHILYNGFQLKHSRVIENILTDHFPIYNEFEI